MWLACLWRWQLFSVLVSCLLIHYVNVCCLLLLPIMKKATFLRNDFCIHKFSQFFTFLCLIQIWRTVDTSLVRVHVLGNYVLACKWSTLMFVQNIYMYESSLPTQTEVYTGLCVTDTYIIQAHVHASSSLYTNEGSQCQQTYS